VSRRINTVEMVIARIATRAWGIVTRSELLAAGVTDDQIRHRLRTGALIRVYLGVYRVGHRAPCVEARYMAAVKACGAGAVLSGPAAAYLWGLTKGTAPPPHVTTVNQRRPAGITVRRIRQLDPDDITTCRRIPIATVARTLVDIAATLSLGALARACHEAGIRHGTTPAMVEAVLGRRSNSVGAATLRRVLRGDVKVTLSELERRFLELLRQAGLPMPETNRPAGGRRVDRRWPAYGLTVELDSYRFHNSRYSWEQDRRREREAYARGDEFRRYSYDDVFGSTAAMLAELRKLLGSAPGPRG
jgi:predicted transcriptional regulator of viral defense system